jgi:hypothetical protein
MLDLQIETLKRIVTSVIIFLITLALFMTLYQMVTAGVESSLTGNIVYDGLLIIVPIIFGAAVMFIMYKRYASKGD